MPGSLLKAAGLSNRISFVFHRGFTQLGWSTTLAFGPPHSLVPLENGPLKMGVTQKGCLVSTPVFDPPQF